MYQLQSHSGSLKIFPNPAGCLQLNCPHVTNPSGAARTVSAHGVGAVPGHAADRSSQVEKVVGGSLVDDADPKTPAGNPLKEALKVLVVMEGSSQTRSSACIKSERLTGFLADKAHFLPHAHTVVLWQRLLLSR